MALSSERGFTLVELIITMVLLGIMFSIGATLLSQNMTNTLMVSSGQSALDRARYALGRAGRELREVTYDSTVTPNVYNFSTLAANATSVTFTRSISGTSNSVTLALSGTTLNLTYLPSGGTATTSALLDHVSSFALNFYDGDGVATTSKVDVRFVEMTVVVSDTTSGQSMSQRMRVALRNT